MSKRRKGKKSHPQRSEKRQPADAARTPAPPPREFGGLARLTLGLAVAGMALTAYLTAVKWFGTTPLYCGKESSCDIVQSSRWSTLLGFPLSFWGFLTYAVLAALIWKMRRRRSTWSKATLVACVGFVISVYLTAVSVFEIQATCAYCLVSLAILTAIFALLCWMRPRQIPEFQWTTWLPKAALSAVLAVAVLHLHYSGVFNPAAGPEKPYLAALATHLEESGAKFYGAYWCPRCQEQKALFGASAERLPYVECKPGGPDGPETVTCATKNIDNYPTWIIGGRRYIGVKDPETLASHSDFRWEEPSR